MFTVYSMCFCNFQRQSYFYFVFLFSYVLVSCFIESFFLLLNWNVINPIQDGPFRGFSPMGGGSKRPSSIIFISHIPQWWNLARSYCTNHVTPFFYWHQHFFNGNQQLLYIKKCKYRYIISSSFNFFESLKISFNKHGCNFDDVSKIGYSRPS